MFWVFLGCCLPIAAGQADSAWTRCSPSEVSTAKSTRPQRLRERSGTQLVLEQGRLRRLKAGQPRPLAPTPGNVPGRILDLVADPFGLSFVASEGGLYVTSPESPWLDPVRLADGAPSEPPSSLAFDGERRLWMAGPTQFGVLQPSHFYGRTLTPPSAGPYSILRVSEGRLWLLCGAQCWSYQIDQGAPPELLSVRLAAGAQALTAGSLLASTHGQGLGLAVRARAAGGPVLRYALDDSHVWSPWPGSSGAFGADLDPGLHKLEIVAMDRDLRLSEPFVLAWRVDYPFYYRTEFVLGVGVLLGLAVFGFFLRRARGSQAAAELPRPFWRALLSSGILLTLGLEILAGVIPHGRGWPFIGYSMYTEGSNPGSISYNGVVIGLGERGVPLRLPLGTMGIASDNRWQVLRPLMDSGDVSQRFLEAYNAKNPAWEQVIRLQVWAKRTLLTEQGPLQIAPLILGDHLSGSAQ